MKLLHLIISTIIISLFSCKEKPKTYTMQKIDNTTIIGNIYYKDSLKTKYRAPYSGIVTYNDSLAVNHKINKDTPLFRILSDTLDYAIKKAQIEFKYYKNEYYKNKKLSGNNAISNSQLSNIKLEYDIKNIELQKLINLKAMHTVKTIKEGFIDNIHTVSGVYVEKGDIILSTTDNKKKAVVYVNNRLKTIINKNNNPKMITFFNNIGDSLVSYSLNKLDDIDTLNVPNTVDKIKINITSNKLYTVTYKENNFHTSQIVKIILDAPIDTISAIITNKNKNCITLYCRTEINKDSIMVKEITAKNINRNITF